MAGNTQPSDIDPQMLEHAQSFWAGFTKATTYSVLGIIVILLGMAVFLL